MNGLALRERRLIAIALLLALVAAVWLGVVRPVIGGFQDRADQRIGSAERLRPQRAGDPQLSPAARRGPGPSPLRP